MFHAALSCFALATFAIPFVVVSAPHSTNATLIWLAIASTFTISGWGFIIAGVIERFRTRK